nr:hypothetical protein [Tanacetum cinerariifolium]
MNYEPVSIENQANKSASLQEAKNSACTQANDDQGANSEEINLRDKHFVLPIWSAYSTSITSSGDKIGKNEKPVISAVGPSKALNNDELSYPDDPSMPHLKDIYASPSAGIFTNLSYDDKVEPKKISQALEDKSWVDAMQEELLQFQIQKSAFLYGTIDEEVYVTQPPGFLDPKFPNKVYKVVKALYGLHQAPRAWYATLSTFLERSGYRIGAIDKTLFIKQDKKDIMLVQVKQKEDGIFISQDKYVAKILKKFDFLSVKTASTPIETHKPLVKDEEAADVDVHLYRSMIGSLMYLI